MYRSLPKHSSKYLCFFACCLTFFLFLTQHRAQAQNWSVSVTYTGNASTTYTASIGAHSLSTNSYVGNGSTSYPVGPNGFDLSQVANNPTNSTTGGMTGTLYVGADCGMQNGHATNQQTGSGQMTITLTWRPKNGDALHDPAPANFAIVYTRRTSLTVTANANDAGTTATATGTISCGGVTSSDSLTNSGASGSRTTPMSDAMPIVSTLATTNGVATLTVPLSWSLSPYADAGMQLGGPAASTSGIMAVDITIPGMTMSRANERHDHLGGQIRQHDPDPSFTRWMPLSYSPTISSQPFRMAPGALPAPWGNGLCAYSMVMQAEPVPAPNFDLTGFMLLFLPGSPPVVLSGGFAPAFNITDANGDRLLFTQFYAAYNDILSLLVQTDTGFELRNAGPPGQIREKGSYTYVFQTASTTGQPYLARLVAIKEDLLNGQPPLVHTLTWNSLAAPTGDPFLTVTDNSSGRRLLFHPGTYGYVGSVDALGPSGNTINTHTTATYDTNGHLTDIKVYNGSGSTLYRQNHYQYSGDSVTQASQPNLQGGQVVLSTSYSYVGDNTLTDPANNATPRLSSVTYGDASDTRSGSDTGGAVAGTYYYTYGPQREGYNSWGVDAHTNTVKDPYNNVTSILLTLANFTWGPVVAETTTAPDFTGAAPGTNISKTVYAPNIDTPSTITFYDQLYMNGLSSNGWVTQLDSNRNVTSATDPLSHGLSFAYAGDGTQVSQITDSTNLHAYFHYGETINSITQPFNRLTSVLDNTSAIQMQFTYNNWGQLLTSRVPAGVAASGQDETTTFSYNEANGTGDLLQVTNPAGDVLTINGYDLIGDPTSTSLYPTGVGNTSLTTSIIYDPAQMPITLTDPTGTSLNTTFNNGVATQFTLVNQGVTLSQTNISRDSRGRVYSASDLVGTAAQYKYDKRNNLTKVIDGLNHTTSFAYGNDSELLGVT